MGKGSIKTIGKLQKGNLTARYGSLCKQLDKYRIERELFEARKTVLPFVTGLRFSALLIYEMRTILKNTNLAVNWGTIIDDTGDKCAAECDIIIHKNGSEFAWNGEIDVGGSVMDFHFVNQQNVQLVVSCKAFELLHIDQNMRDDIVKLCDYVDNVWLFVEYCKSKKLCQLRADARNAGYKELYPLYLEKEDGTLDYDENIWCEFAQSLQELSTN
jgi:hypothetical protein